MLFSFSNDLDFHSVCVNIISILLSTLQVLPGSEHRHMQWRIRVLCNLNSFCLLGPEDEHLLFCFKFHEVMILFSLPLSILCAKALEGIGRPGCSKHSLHSFSYSEEIKVDCPLFYIHRHTHTHYVYVYAYMCIYLYVYVHWNNLYVLNLYVS